MPSALQHWRNFLRPGGRLAFNCWAEDSHATGQLLRRLAARHGICVAVVGEDTGTPERCRTLLETSGYDKFQVIVEPTSHYLSPEQLDSFPEIALKNPVYGHTVQDASKLLQLRDEYRLEVRSDILREEINAEMGAYFVVAYNRN